MMRFVLTLFNSSAWAPTVRTYVRSHLNRNWEHDVVVTTLSSEMAGDEPVTQYEVTLVSRFRDSETVKDLIYAGLAECLEDQDVSIEIEIDHDNDFGPTG